MSSNEMSAIQAAKPRRFKVASPEPVDRAGSASEQFANLKGLGPMSQVKTAFGGFPAQTLRTGDRVEVRSGGYLPIVSVERITFDEEFLRYHPGAQPIVIRRGAFSPCLPEHDLVLAPFQRIDTAASRMPARLEKAIEAINRPHVFRKPEQIITYTIISVGRPAFIKCDGVWVELTA